jgi:hypothetical protein
MWGWWSVYLSVCFSVYLFIRASGESAFDDRPIT